MPEVTDIHLQTFESMVRTLGPEIARRNFEQLFGAEETLRVRHDYERKVGVITNLPGSPTLHEKRFEDWYSGPGDDDQFWPPLKKHLLEKKRWPASTVDSLDRESTNVMKHLQPVFGPVDVKGLVVGYVQSGKTANYSALIAKAADVGYRLIIVLAGIHNSLRRQTQIRLQAELINADERVKTMWHTLTQPQEDFRPRGTNTDAFLSHYSHQRILLVVKKNAHVLTRLIKWLKAAQPRLLEECPALLIDDEADQAGLNTGKIGEAQRTAINRLILDLKKTLPKSAYVGYTATPFANVLVDPSGADLYPSDFIVALTKPPDYFGAELYFGRDPLENEGEEPPSPPDLFRVVQEDEVPFVRPNPGSADSFEPALPESLHTAIEYFLLAAAARWARGQRLKHSSMLVHTTMNLSAHRKLKGCIDTQLKQLEASLQAPDVRARLERLWSTEQAKTRRESIPSVPFSAVESTLPGVFQRLRVVVDNSQSDSRLFYKEEAELDDKDDVVHIAVGGNTLSRGLTLEGLMVSYFVRGASAYDTLLQMGRWFGYRFGYEDLPRVWMTDELRQAFHDLATVEEEIRNDIARYEEQKVTPREFAVRIRTHPTLTVTSRLKMQHAVVVQIDYSGFTRQTTYFHHQDRDWLRTNWEAGAALVDQLIRDGHSFERDGSQYYVKGVKAERVLSFLDRYACHPHHAELRREFLRQYVEKQNARGECRLWTVGAVTLTAPRSAPRSPTVSLGALEVTLVTRSKLDARGTGADLGTITTQANFRCGLGEPDTSPSSGDTKKRQPKRPAGSEPLLLLVPINKDSIPATARVNTRSPLEAAAHVLGIALAFPDSPTKRTAENYIQVQLPEPPEYVEPEDALPEEDDG